MAKKKKERAQIKMVSTESAHVYYTQKNKRNDSNRLELKKYDPTLRRHVLYRESK
jgi:large subunit ribosomal protein L33